MRQFAKYALFIFILTTVISGCGNAETANKASEEPTIHATIESASTVASELPEQKTATAQKPKIIDFGSKQCKTCKAMEVILESLKEKHSDRFITEFVDVWMPENEVFAQSYDIQSIPTQVFLNDKGKEIYRNVGLITEEVLAKWKELGILEETTLANEKVMPVAGQ